MNSQEALTRWKVVSSMKDASLLAVAIETGRTHQIRRHLEAAGHPVLGDKRYGDFPANRAARQRWGLRRMFLHAWRLEPPAPDHRRAAPARGAAAGGAAEALSRMNLAPPATPAGGRAGGSRAPRPHGER